MLYFDVHPRQINAGIVARNGRVIPIRDFAEKDANERADAEAQIRGLREVGNGNYRIQSTGKCRIRPLALAS